MDSGKVIDKNKAHPAVDKLASSGLITPSEAETLRRDVDRMISLRSHAIRVLGNVIGPLWLSEEENEYRVITGAFMIPHNYSVPEWIINSTDPAWPWHDETFPGLHEFERFHQEASEPWHWSLSFGKVIKNKKVSSFFARNDYNAKTVEILSMTYPEI